MIRHGTEAETLYIAIIHFTIFLLKILCLQVGFRVE
nr:MAG TPA: hypothetical protein [Caudoviricetes sp.]